MPEVLRETIQSSGSGHRSLMRTGGVDSSDGCDCLCDSAALGTGVEQICYSCKNALLVESASGPASGCALWNRLVELAADLLEICLRGLACLFLPGSGFLLAASACLGL